MSETNPYSMPQEPLSPELQRLWAIAVHALGIVLEFFCTAAGLPISQRSWALHSPPRDRVAQFWNNYVASVRSSSNQHCGLVTVLGATNHLDSF